MNMGARQVHRLWALLIVAPLWLGSPMEGPVFAAPEPAGIVAVVNGTRIYREDHARAMDDLKMRHVTAGRRGVDYDSPEVQTEVLESLINQELLFQEARRRGLSVDKEMVDAQLAKVKEQYGSEAAFQNALAAVNQSEEELRQQLRRYLLIQVLVLEQIYQKTDVSEETLRAYYEDHPRRFSQPANVLASHVFIRVRPDAPEEEKAAARSDLEALRVQLEDGADFVTAAQEFTRSHPRAEGGDLALVMRGQMPRPFEEVAFAMDPDTVSRVVETEEGFYLIKVVDSTPETKVPFDKIREELKKRLTQEKVQRNLRTYIAELKSKATIKRYLLDE